MMVGVRIELPLGKVILTGKGHTGSSKGARNGLCGEGGYMDVAM